MAIFRPPPNPFVGGLQPLEPGKLPADLISVPPPPIDNPPFDQRRLEPIFALLKSWLPPPQPQRTQPKRIESVDNPPSFSTAIISRILFKWLPDRPTIQFRPPYIPEEEIVVVSDLPFTRDYSAILRSWYRAQPAQPLSSKRIESVDLPPQFSIATLTRIIRGWEPKAPQPQRIQPQQIVSIDLPPVVATASPLALRSWKAPSPIQPRRYSYTEGEIVITPDNPPFSARDLRSAILRTWQPKAPIRQRVLGQIESVDLPPFAQRDPFPSILRAWQITPPARQKRARYIVEVVVNNPPFSSRDLRSQILRSWIFPAATRRDYSRLIFPGIIIPEPPIIPPEPPLIVVIPPPAIAQPFVSTQLEASQSYGALGMGSGPFGGSTWTETAETAGNLSSTHLEASEQYGSGSMGSGPFGGTIWTETSGIAGGFQRTFLEESEAYGSGSMGSGPFGGTIWS